MLTLLTSLDHISIVTTQYCPYNAHTIDVSLLRPLSIVPTMASFKGGLAPLEIVLKNKIRP